MQESICYSIIIQCARPTTTGITASDRPRSQMMADKKHHTRTAIPSGLDEFKFGDIRIWLPMEGTREAWDKTKKC